MVLPPNELKSGLHNYFMIAIYAVTFGLAYRTERKSYVHGPLKDSLFYAQEKFSLQIYAPGVFTQIYYCTCIDAFSDLRIVSL